MCFKVCECPLLCCGRNNADEAINRIRGMGKKNNSSPNGLLLLCD